MAPAVKLANQDAVLAWRQLLGGHLSEMQLGRDGAISYRSLDVLDVLESVPCTDPSQVAQQLRVSADVLRRFVLAHDDPASCARFAAGGERFARQNLETHVAHQRDPDGFERVAAHMLSRTLSHIGMFAQLCAVMRSSASIAGDSYLLYLADAANKKLNDAVRELEKGQPVRKSDRPLEHYRMALERLADEDAVSVFWSLPAKPQERLLAAAGIRKIRVNVGLLPIEEREIAMEGAELALAREDLTEQERSDLIEFSRVMTNAIGDDAAVTFAWENASWRTRQLVERERPLFVTADGPFDAVAFREVLRGLVEPKPGRTKSGKRSKTGRPAKFHGREAFELVREAYLTAACLKQPDWTRTPKSKESKRPDGNLGPSGPFIDYLHQVERLYGLRGTLTSEL